MPACGKCETRRKDGALWMGADGRVRKLSGGVTFAWLLCDSCGVGEFYTESSLAGGENLCLDCRHGAADGVGNDCDSVLWADSRYHGFPVENDFPTS